MAEPVFVGSEAQVDKRSQADYTETTFWLGHTLIKWNLLQDELSFLFAATIGTKQLTAVVESFYAISSMEERLGAVDAAIRVVCEKETSTYVRWKTLHDRLINANHERDMLVHGRVVALSVKEKDGSVKYHGTHLIPYYGQFRPNQGMNVFTDDKTLAKRLKHWHPVDASGIKAISETFEKRTVEVAKFKFLMFKLVDFKDTKPKESKDK